MVKETKEDLPTRGTGLKVRLKKKKGKCSIRGCRELDLLKIPLPTSYHQIPMHPEEREKWLEVIRWSHNNPSWTPPNSRAAVCARHFEKSCFSKNVIGTALLRRGSYPTLHINQEKFGNLIAGFVVNREIHLPEEAQNGATGESEDLPEIELEVQTTNLYEHEKVKRQKMTAGPNVPIGKVTMSHWFLTPPYTPRPDHASSSPELNHGTEMITLESDDDEDLRSPAGELPISPPPESVLACGTVRQNSIYEPSRLPRTRVIESLGPGLTLSENRTDRNEIAEEVLSGAMGESIWRSENDIMTKVVQGLLRNEEFTKLRSARLPGMTGSGILNLDLVLAKLAKSGYGNPLNFIEDLYEIDQCPCPGEHLSEIKPKSTFARKNVLVTRIKCHLPELFREEVVKTLEGYKEALHLCCTARRRLAPVVICPGAGDDCDIVIPPGELYFECDRPSEKVRATLCATCYSAYKKGSPLKVVDSVTGLPAASLRGVSKREFVQKKNVESLLEEKVHCVSCRRPYHSICVNYVESACQDTFRCHYCQSAAAASRAQLVDFGHCRTLRETPISVFVEEFVNRRLPPGTKHVFVRIGSCLPSTHKLKAPLADFLQTYGVPSKFPYLSRALLCFQETTDGKCIAFSALYFHEYGDDCPAPNKKSIYISMIDSNQLMELDETIKRRAVLHSVILAYLDFIRRRQKYKYVYLWSCPPKRKEIEYIFYRRPPTHKILDQVTLNSWYKEMMELGSSLNILESWTEMICLAGKPWTPTKLFQTLPYFADDHWPSFILRHLEDKKFKLKDQIGLEPALYRVTMQELQNQGCNFFRIKLKPGLGCQRKNSLDELVPCRIIDNRDLLVNHFRNKSTEFADVRKACHSTKSLLVQMTLETPVIYCDLCWRPIYDGYACQKCCRDFCDTCMRRDRHVHPPSSTIRSLFVLLKKDGKVAVPWMKAAKLVRKAYLISYVRLFANISEKSNENGSIANGHIMSCNYPSCGFCAKVLDLTKSLNKNISTRQ